jgi:hypothetical protein
LQISHGCLQAQQPSHVPIPDTPTGRSIVVTVTFTTTTTASDPPVAALPCSTTSGATHTKMANKHGRSMVDFRIQITSSEANSCYRFWKENGLLPCADNGTSGKYEWVNNCSCYYCSYFICLLGYFCSLRHSPKGVAAFGLLCF